MHICHEEIFAAITALTSWPMLRAWWMAHRAKCKEAKTCGLEKREA